MTEERSTDAEPEPAADLEAPTEPDELLWWQKQLGVPLLIGLYTEKTTGR